MSRVAVAGAIGFGVLLVLLPWWGPSRAEADLQDAGPPASQESGVPGDGRSDASDDEADPSDESDESPAIDPLSVNAACYICHMTFIREELGKVHLKEKITCIECHGLSAPHANDENIGATPPDITYKRSQVDASCEKCHEEHDVPGAKVVARFVERKLANVRPICSDCHGTHKIERAEEGEEDDEGDVTRHQPRPKMQKPATPASK